MTPAMWAVLAVAIVGAFLLGWWLREWVFAVAARRQADAVRDGTRRFYGREWLVSLGRRDLVDKDRYADEDKV